MKNFKEEKTFTNQESAQKWENTKKNQHPGGPKHRGNFMDIPTAIPEENHKNKMKE